MDDYKDMYEEGFWFEMQELAGAFSEICNKYDVSDRIISAFVVGLLEETFSPPEDQGPGRAIC